MKKVLLILLVIVVATGVFVLTINIDKYRPLAEGFLRDSTGYEFDIKKGMSLSILPFGVKLTDVEVKNPYGFDKKSVADLKNVYVVLNPLSLIFGGHFKIKGIILKDPKFYIVRNKKGRLNILTQKRYVSKITKTVFNIGKLTVKNAYLEYRNEKSGKKISVKGIDLKASLKYGVASGNYHHKQAKGYLDFGFLTIGKINPIKNFHTAFSIENGFLNMNPIKYDLFGSKVKGDADVDFSGDCLVQLRQNAEKFNLSQFSKVAYNGLETKGFANLSLNVYFDLTKPIRTLNGLFGAEGKNITLKGADIDKAIETYKKTNAKSNNPDICSFFIVGSLEMLSGKRYKPEYVNKNEHTDIKRMFVKIKIKDGKGYLKDVAFSTHKNRIAAEGILDFAESKYDDVRVAVLDKDGCASIVRKVEGKFAKPRIVTYGSVLNKLMHKIDSFVNSVEKTIGVGKTGCKAFYNGEVKQP